MTSLTKREKKSGKGEDGHWYSRRRTPDGEDEDSLIASTGHDE